MCKPLKIAVYSGEIPSTTFIERLIAGLAKNHCRVFLFGYLKSTKKYSEHIYVHGYNDNRIYKFYLLLKYSILLFLFRREDKHKLDEIIKSKNISKAITKIKYYPVLWHKPDIFHLQWAKSIEDWIWVQEFGIKMVVSLRGTHITISPISNAKIVNRYKKHFPLVDGFHAVSKNIAQAAELHGAHFEKTKVVYSGLSESINSIKYEKGSEVFKMVSIGRNHWVKGYNYAIYCAKILKEKGFVFEYQIIGGKNSEELEFLIRANNSEKEVILTPLKPYQEVQQIIQQADLLLLPSVEEGIANVVLEAMQLGTLVLTANCGGMDEVIINGENGFMMPVRDAAKMADTVLDIANLSQNQVFEVVENAKKTILRQHSEVKMIDEILLLYNQVLNR